METRISATIAILFLFVITFAGCSADDVIDSLSGSPTYALTAAPSGTMTGGTGTLTVYHSAGVGWIYVSMSDYVGASALGLATPSGPTSTNTNVTLTGGGTGTMFVDLVELYDADALGGGAFGGTNWTANQGDPTYTFLNIAYDGVNPPVIGLPGASSVPVGTVIAN